MSSMNHETIKVACSNCNLRELCMPIGLNHDELNRIDDLVATRRHVKRGDTLFRSGDKFSSLYAIRTGFFKTCVATEDGRDQVTGFQMAGEVIGLDGIVSDNHSCDAVALEDAEVCVMPYDRIEDLSREVHGLQRARRRDRVVRALREPARPPRARRDGLARAGLCGDACRGRHDRARGPRWARRRGRAHGRAVRARRRPARGERARTAPPHLRSPHDRRAHEQPVRAVGGPPLGSGDAVAPAAAMANLLGDLWAGGAPDWRAGLASPTTRLHLYGKDDARPGRKMGHLTSLAATPAAAEATVREARAALTRGRPAPAHGA